MVVMSVLEQRRGGRVCGLVASESALGGITLDCAVEEVEI